MSADNSSSVGPVVATQATEPIAGLAGQWSLEGFIGAHQYLRSQGIGPVQCMLERRTSVGLSIAVLNARYTIVTRTRRPGRAAAWARLELVADDSTEAVAASSLGVASWYARVHRDVLVAEAHRGEGALMERYWVQGGKLKWESTDTRSGLTMCRSFRRLAT